MKKVIKDIMILMESREHSWNVLKYLKEDEPDKYRNLLFSKASIYFWFGNASMGMIIWFQISGIKI